MEEKIILDRETLKALLVDSRLDILKLLNNKKYTQSDLADLLNLSKPTIKEHLDILEKANLIKKENTQRKWKFYSLSFKGKKIVAPDEIKVFFAFVINIALIVGAISFWIKESFFKYSADDVMPMLASNAEYSTKMAMARDVVEVSNYEPIKWIYIVILVLSISASFLLGYYFKKKTIIIR